MSLPSFPVLEQLYNLDRSSSGFHDQLTNVLYGEEYRQCVPNLLGDSLIWLVEYLNNVLDSLDTTSPGFRKCLRELKHICSTGEVLPESYILSSSLLNIGPDPFASGGSGDVYQGTLDGSRVCAKRVRVYTKEGMQGSVKIFYREAVMWKRLVHPNILPLLGITITPLQLISTWMPGGDLTGYIKNHTDADRLGLLSDVVKGLCHLHSCNVIHGDLKGPNILVDDYGNARIADFGFTTVTQNSDSMGTASCHHGNTPRWTAPEVLKGEPYSKEADIFAFAMVMIEVFTGVVPFSNEQPFTAGYSIMQGKRPPRPMHPAFTDDLWILMQRCWDDDPHLRPRVSEVLEVLLIPEHPAWKQLTGHTLTIHGRVSLITTIFSDDNQVKRVGQLTGDDTQNLIDMIDEGLDSLTPEIRRRCLCYLYGICDRQAIFPKSLIIPLCYNQTGHSVCHGGSADVWKGEHCSQDVAAKVLRVYSRSDLGPTRRRFCRQVMAWRALRHPNVLRLLGVTVTENRFVMVSEWMARGSINEFVKADIGADRLELLRDVTRGLIYMHNQGMIHGNLTGANILIDNNGCACLAGFGQLTMVSGQSTITSSATPGGTIRWMSPELFDPDRFGLEGNNPTKESDCYGLGMVIYEVLSGETPYTQYGQLVLIQNILDGERPSRPLGAQGEWFTDSLWQMLELCWEPQPDHRPSLNAVLQCLQDATRPPKPPDVDGGVETAIDDQSFATVNDSRLPIAHDENGSLAPTQTGSWKERWTDNMLVRNVLKLFKGTA